MGQAKRRGSYDQRKTAAQKIEIAEQKEAEQKEAEQQRPKGPSGPVAQHLIMASALAMSALEELESKHRENRSIPKRRRK